MQEMLERSEPRAPRSLVADRDKPDASRADAATTGLNSDTDASQACINGTLWAFAVFIRIKDQTLCR